MKVGDTFVYEREYFVHTKFKGEIVEEAKSEDTEN